MKPRVDYTLPKRLRPHHPFGRRRSSPRPHELEYGFRYDWLANHPSLCPQSGGEWQKRASENPAYRFVLYLSFECISLSSLDTLLAHKGRESYRVYDWFQSLRVDRPSVRDRTTVTRMSSRNVFGWNRFPSRATPIVLPCAGTRRNGQPRPDVTDQSISR